jgi:proteic killer suppression protein
MRIVSVRDKRIQALIDAPDLKSVKGLDPFEVRKMGPMIVAIQAMSNPQQLTSVPSWRAHELTGNEAGIWSLTVTRNYRLTFLVDTAAQTVSLLDYRDYH